MNSRALEKKMKETYDPIAKRYRSDDERDASGADHGRICHILGHITASFDRPISVLDIGCGTGRFFHSLKNTRKLIGMDVSEAMLEQARRPVRESDISVQQIELINGNFYTHTFPSASFDFIYAIGVFGNGCAVTVDLCNKLHDWLTPNGCLYFDAVDTSNEPAVWRLRRKARQFIYSLLPQSVQDAWDRRAGWLPFFMATQSGISHLLQKTKFSHHSVEKRPYQLTMGPGAKLECFASKTRFPALPTET